MKQKLTTKAIKTVLRNEHGLRAIYFSKKDGMKTAVWYKTDKFIAFNYGRDWRDQEEEKIQSLPSLRNFDYFLVVDTNDQISRWEYEHRWLPE